MTAFPHLKLSYFDFDGGRGETIRLALVLGKIPFEDDRLNREGFAAVRHELPYGALPVLFIDGKPLAQSNAIARYVGKLTDMYPATPWDAAKCDEIMDAVEEVTMHIGSTMPLNDELKKSRRETLVAEVLPNLLKGMGARLLENGGEFMVGPRMTVADLKVSDLIAWLCSGVLDHIPKNFVEGLAPSLVRLQEKVSHIPAIKAYYAARAKT